jgi:hypothetical protein
VLKRYVPNSESSRLSKEKVYHQLSRLLCPSYSWSEYSNQSSPTSFARSPTVHLQREEEKKRKRRTLSRIFVFVRPEIYQKLLVKNLHLKGEI